MENSIIRVTKVQKLEAIKGALPENATCTFSGNDKKQAYVFNYAEMVKFLDTEIAMLKKKNSSSGDKKLTKDQQKNEEYKALILRYLSSAPETVITATDAMENILRPAYPSVIWTTQKTTALLSAIADKYDKEGNLIAEGKLTRTVGKGKTKTTFKIKPECVLDVDVEDIAE